VVERFEAEILTVVGIVWDLEIAEETAGRSIILGASDALEYPFIIGVPSLDVEARAARLEPLRGAGSPPTMADSGRGRG
jgi:hypothetical protein